MAFYGPMHNVLWGLLGLMSRLSPRSMARQTLAIFSTHDTDDALNAPFTRRYREDRPLLSGSLLPPRRA